MTVTVRKSDSDGDGHYLAVTDAPVLLESLEDLVLAAEGGCGVEGQLLQVVRDARGEGHLVPGAGLVGRSWGRN